MDEVTKGHAGYTLAEYEKMGYVLRLKGKNGPYFEKVVPEVPTGPAMPKPKRRQRRELEAPKTNRKWIAPVIAMALIIYSVLHVIAMGAG